MVKLDKIYTRGGDSGITSLGNGERVSKTSPIIRALSSVDELNASIGLARVKLEEVVDSKIKSIQNDLFDLGADLCIPIEKNETKSTLRISNEHIKRLEEEIDEMNASLPSLNSFILPGGELSASRIHLSRTICRKTEIEIIELTKSTKINDYICKYINRLSDHLFVTARYLNSLKSGDILWVPGKNI